MKSKQFQKGVKQLVEEGTVQAFRTTDRTADLILGVVGELQFEVFSYRLKAEYGADIRLQRLPYQLSRWVYDAEKPIKVSRLSNLSTTCVTDQDDNLVVLCENEYALQWLVEKNSDLAFYTNPYQSDDYREVSSAR